MSDLEDTPNVDFDKLLNVFLATVTAPSQPNSDQPQQTPTQLLELEQCLTAINSLCNAPVERANEDQKGYTARKRAYEKITAYMEAYCEPGQDEIQRYPAFVRLSNAVLELVGADDSPLKGLLRPPDAAHILFHINHPQQVVLRIDGSDIRRFPDIVIVAEKSAKDAFKKSDGDENSEMTRPQLVDFAARPTIVKEKANLRKRFPVDAILSCVEFKKTTDMAAPPKAWPRDQQPRFANPKTIDDVIQAWDKNCSRDAPVSAESSAAANNPSTPGVTAPSTSSSLHPAGQKRKAVAEDDIGFNSQETNRQRTAVEIEPEVYPPVVQSASYGLLSLNRAAGVLKVISMFVEDQTLWLWIYDRQGAIQSYGLDFIKDFPRFVVLLAAFQRFNRQDWGFNPDLEPLRVPTDPVKLIFTTPGTGSAPIHTYTVTLTKDILYERPTLCGRASHVVTVTVERDGEAYTGEGAGGDEFVLKVGWPESTRISEVQIIAKAKEIADQEPEGKHYITGHLPEVICSKDLPESYATGTIRTALGLLPKQMRGGSRTCRLTVFVKLRMLTGLPPLHFLSLFRPIVTCHFFLWIKGVKHCDISLQNLMQHPRTGLGILNDFDLSRIDGYQSENLERTGTVPFLSMDILSNPDFQRGRGLVEATYKHDCDSFKWVFLYVCCIDTPNSVVEQWHTNDPEKCLLVKSNFLVPLTSDAPFKVSAEYTALTCQANFVFDDLHDDLQDAAFARDRRMTRLRRQAALADEQTVQQLQGDRGFLAVPQDEPKRGVKRSMQLQEPEEEPVPLSVVPSELWDVFMDMLDDLQPSSGR